MINALVCIHAQPLSLIDFDNPKDYEIGYLRFPDRSHIDPEFIGFTYCDDIKIPRAANLGKIGFGDYIFFQETFGNKHKTIDKRRYIFGYLRIKGLSTIKEIYQRGLTHEYPYCHNDHVKHMVKTNCTLFIGNPQYSKKLVTPIWLNKELIKELDLRDRHDNSIYDQFDNKRISGRPMTDIEVLNVYTRTVKILTQEQVNILLRKINL